MSEVAIAERADSPQNTLIGPKRPPVTAEKEAVIAMLQAEGMTTKAIAETLGLSKGTIYNVNTRLKKNGNNPLLTPKRIKAATKVIDTFMQGKRIGIVEEKDPITGEIKITDAGVKPKCSTIKACADSVLDRAYPKAQDDAGRGNVSFTQVNISLAGPMSGMAQNPPTDISPCSVASPIDNKG